MVSGVCSQSHARSKYTTIPYNSWVDLFDTWHGGQTFAPYHSTLFTLLHDWANWRCRVPVAHRGGSLSARQPPKVKKWSLVRGPQVGSRLGGSRGCLRPALGIPAWSASMARALRAPPIRRQWLGYQILADSECKIFPSPPIEKTVSVPPIFLHPRTIHHPPSTSAFFVILPRGVIYSLF
jgi:hypothetical protein